MQAKITNLPDEDHVMRYVSWGRLRKDEDDNVLGFLGDAFKLKPNEDYLSVNWLEYFDGDREAKIQASVGVLKIQASVGVFRKTLDVGGKSAFGIGNVAKIKEVCRGNGANVRIVYEPRDDNKSHSGIRRLPRDDFTLLEALAADVCGANTQCSHSI
jgi:hypothetical protein